MDATRLFFLRELPALIATSPARFQALHGTIAFSCAGQKFTVRLGDLEEPVVEGFARTADLKLWFFGDAFERFLAGQLPRGPKSLRAQGDVDALDRFGRLLLPAVSSLSVRCAA